LIHAEDPNLQGHHASEMGTEPDPESDYIFRIRIQIRI